MKLVELFPKSMMVLDLKARDKKGAIRELLDHLVVEGKLSEDAAKKAEKGVHKREAQGTTGIGKGLAIPHAKNVAAIGGVLGVFGRSFEGLPFESVDGDQVNVLFMILSSVDYADAHLQVMKKVARLNRDDKTLRFLATTTNQDSIVGIFEELDDGQP